MWPLLLVFLEKRTLLLHPKGGPAEVELGPRCAPALQGQPVPPRQLTTAASAIGEGPEAGGGESGRELGKPENFRAQRGCRCPVHTQGTAHPHRQPPGGATRGPTTTVPGSSCPSQGAPGRSEPRGGKYVHLQTRIRFVTLGKEQEMPGPVLTPCR